MTETISTLKDSEDPTKHLTVSVNLADDHVSVLLWDGRLNPDDNMVAEISFGLKSGIASAEVHSEEQLGEDGVTHILYDFRKGRT